MRAYEDIIAAGPTPKMVAEFRASEETRSRVADLVRREKAGELSPDEASELEHWLGVEHLMRLAKARARQNLARESNTESIADGTEDRT